MVLTRPCSLKSWSGTFVSGSSGSSDSSGSSSTISSSGSINCSSNSGSVSVTSSAGGSVSIIASFRSIVTFGLFGSTGFFFISGSFSTSSSSTISTLSNLWLYFSSWEGVSGWYWSFSSIALYTYFPSLNHRIRSSHSSIHSLIRPASWYFFASSYAHSSIYSASLKAVSAWICWPIGARLAFNILYFKIYWFGSFGAIFLYRS